jgi:hypothetical protein
VGAAIIISLLSYILISGKINMDTQVPLAFVVVVSIVLLAALDVGIVVKIMWSFCLNDRVEVENFERKKKKKAHRPRAD